MPTEIEILTSTVAALQLEKNGKADVLSGTKDHNEVLNHERSIQWDKDASAVIFWLRQCCTNDIDVIEEQGTPKKAWDALYQKYSKVKAGELRQLEREITSFDRSSQAPGKSPEDCFAYLKVLRRRFLLLKPEKKESLNDENLFGYLLDGLSELEWKLTKETLDAQPRLDCDDKLDVLQQVWDRTPSLQSAPDEEAFVAKTRWPKSRLRGNNIENKPSSMDKNRSRSPSSRARGSQCYQCKSEEHRVDTCPYVGPAKKWAYRQRLQDEKQDENYKRQPTLSNSAQNRPHMRERHVHFNSSSTAGKAYTAHDDNDESLEDSPSSDQTDSEIEEECMMAHGVEPSMSKQKHPKPSYIFPAIWHPDTAASSHMTDNPKAFKGPLRATRRTIKVGGGKLSCHEMGDALMVTKNGTALLKDCLYVPGLGANLLSVRKACAHADLKGVLDSSKMYLMKDNKIVLTASHENGVYAVESVTPNGISEMAFNTQEIKTNPKTDHQDVQIDKSVDFQMIDNDINNYCIQSASQQGNISNMGLTQQISCDTKPIWSKKELIYRNQINKYHLMHRRLGHVGSAAIAKVHNVTTLKKPILIPQTLPKCDICMRANIKNFYSKISSARKEKRLAVISVDIAGPFPISIRGYSYFAEVVDNWSRKVWVILLAYKSELPAKQNELSIMLEKQSGEEILAGRSDGAPEILKLFGEWKSKRGIVTQTTAPYSSNQNGIAERAIQTSEREARAMLEDSKMPVEFWDYAVESGAYVRNRLQRGL